MGKIDKKKVKSLWDKINPAGNMPKKIYTYEIANAREPWIYQGNLHAKHPSELGHKEGGLQGIAKIV